MGYAWYAFQSFVCLFGPTVGQLGSHPLSRAGQLGICLSHSVYDRGAYICISAVALGPRAWKIGWRWCTFTNQPTNQPPVSGPPVQGLCTQPTVSVYSVAGMCVVSCQVRPGNRCLQVMCQMVVPSYIVLLACYDTLLQVFEMKQVFVIQAIGLNCLLDY